MKKENSGAGALLMKTKSSGVGAMFESFGAGVVSFLQRLHSPESYF